MSIRTTSITAGTEPIPGYTLRKRLGSGGYGEVWLADAPGGLSKAIKLIYGTVDDSRAANELRSLERIRSVHHPFLLSLERIEIVQGKVIIVTELAESSLQDRFQTSRRQGSPGLPRVELLDYLRDSADALDYLAQKHSLQHLDVKPGNLLIIANHIKVADFGLVKDLHDPNQSLVSGLTPTYSAPEVFDGRPDFRSDQYSLAIVYMEMLTGRLPFNGKTPGELARQHLTQAPNLDPLPPADRGIVQRALSKNPLDRYTTCRQFVDQLLKVRSAVVPMMDSGDRSGANEETPSHGVLVTDTRNWSSGRKQHFTTKIPLKQFSHEWHTPRAMFIGIGGQGVLALRELRNDLLHNVDCRLTCDDYGWLAIDTAREQLESVIDGSKLVRLPSESAVLLPIQSPQMYRKVNPDLFTPLSRRWLYNIPKSLSTEGVRPIATLALIAHYPGLFKLIEANLVKQIRAHEADTDCKSPLKIYLAGSLHGGTGSALLTEVGMMVRRIFSKHSYKNYRICAVASVAAATNNQSGANLRCANAIASLSELSLMMNSTVEKLSLDYRSGPVTSCESPFDWVTLVDGGLLEDRKSAVDNPKRLARAISLDCQTLSGAALSDSRKQWRNDGTGWLRTSRTESIQSIDASTPEALAKYCGWSVIDGFEQFLAGKSSSGLTDTESVRQSTSATKPNVSGTSLPLTKDAIDEMIRKTLRDLRLVVDGGITNDDVTAWANRLSVENENRNLQIAKDIDAWKKTISRYLQLRAYTWRQIERIQLEVIQGLLNFMDGQLSEVVAQLKPFSDRLPKTPNLVATGREYMEQLTKACVQFMEVVRGGTEQLVQELRTWKSNLSEASNGLREISELGVSELSPQTQALCSQVTSQLEKKLFGKIRHILLAAPGSLGLPLIEKPEELDDEDLTDDTSVLEHARNLVLETCNQMGINPSDLECRMYHHSVIAMPELSETSPSLADGGGEVVRLVVVNEDQIQGLKRTLDEQNLTNHTTIIPGNRCLGMQLVCDAVNLNLPQIVASLWRPNGTTLSLAERVRTRVDIEWEDASVLLSKSAVGMEESRDSEASETRVPPIQAPLSQELDSSTINLA